MRQSRRAGIDKHGKEVKNSSVSGNICPKNQRRSIDRPKRIKNKITDAIADGVPHDPLDGLHSVRVVAHDTIGTGSNQSASRNALPNSGQCVVLHAPVKHDDDESRRIAPTHFRDA